jgi:hypothetical protein
MFCGARIAALGEMVREPVATIRAKRQSAGRFSLRTPSL